MRPQDIVVLLKILCYGKRKWYSKDLAENLYLSTAEVSNSLERSAVSGLIDATKKKVRVRALLDFLIFGLPYVFPQRPGSQSRGIPTAHSHPFMQEGFLSEQQYVWPDAASDEKGAVIQPLYPGAASAARRDEKLYLMLALVDVLRAGKTREKTAAIAELEKIMNES